ncbi:chymotrypsinogen A-like [Mytilus edulis]|uniref:chymotrypsinogen A-like n=1 Tax=Mytilus edulis TaxID=6550 RepID=UPI0039EF5F77
MYKVFLVSVFVVLYMATVTTAASIKIVNGDNADIEDHPWMVSLQIRNGGVNFTHECGGTIIDKNWVLTAGHCNIIFPPHKAKNMQIAAGSSFKSQMKEIIPVKKYYIHESFDTGKNFLQNDLMLLELQKPLTFGSTINKIDLDTNVGHNYTGEVCTITGWGDKDAARRGNFPDRLQVHSMPVVTTEYCRSTWTLFWKYPLFPEAYWNKLICLQDNDKDSCQADSGGPVVCSNKLVGALSFGSTPCDGRRPSVHTRISAFLDWIKDKMNTKNNKNQKDKKKKKNDKGKSDGKGKSEGKGKSGEKGKGKTN